MKSSWKYQHSSHFNETNQYRDNRSRHTSGLQFPVPHIFSWSLLDIDWLRSAFFSWENTLFSCPVFFSQLYQIHFHLKTNQMYIAHCRTGLQLRKERIWYILVQSITAFSLIYQIHVQPNTQIVEIHFQVKFITSTISIMISITIF